MSEQTKPEANLDDLTKTAEPGSSDLKEAELDRVSGGSAPAIKQTIGGALHPDILNTIGGALRKD